LELITDTLVTRWIGHEYRVHPIWHAPAILALLMREEWGDVSIIRANAAHGVEAFQSGHAPTRIADLRSHAGVT